MGVVALQPQCFASPGNAMASSFKGRRGTEFLAKERNSLLDLIRSCTSPKDLSKAVQIHSDIVSDHRQFLQDAYVNKALITMYVKCGALVKAREVFEGLAERDVVAWTSLISGYAHHGYGDEALEYYRRMRNEGFSPNAVTFISVLKACNAPGSLDVGESVHEEAKKMGLVPKHLVLGTSLISMYAKCGVLERARGVFDQLPSRDVVSWNALICGYADHGYGNEALQCLAQMRDEGTSPNAVTFLASLKACRAIGGARRGDEIYAEIKRRGLLEKNIMLGTAAVDMYAKCGLLGRAKEVFDELPAKDAISWNALISGYAQQGLGSEALSCFGRMREEGISPSAVTYVCVLNACSGLGALAVGEEIHGEVRRKRLLLLGKDAVLGTALVDMYARCGALRKAQRVFDDELPVRTAATWNALMCGYAQQGQGDEAVKCFYKMRGEGISPNSVTFICILKICSGMGSLELGEEVRGEVCARGLLAKDIVVGTALVDMYAKCGALGKAREVFDALALRDVVAWNALVSGYVQHGQCDEALDCFAQMRDEGLAPDGATLACVLNVCGSVGNLALGEAIHAEIRGDELLLLRDDVVLGTALVDMYAKCGALDKAREAFDGLPLGDAISWNALISGYAEHGLADQALGCYAEMREMGIPPNLTTLISALKACGMSGRIGLGEEIHAEITDQGLLRKDVVLGTGLVDMYAKCGRLARAREVFEQIPVRDVVCWNALLSGYAQHELGDQVLECFSRMRGAGLSPNAVTFSCVLRACGSLGCVETGSEIHAEIESRGLLGNEIALRGALLDMYAKCGELGKAHRVFRELPGAADVVAWNTIIAGYAHMGLARGVFRLFAEMMEDAGASPNPISFLVLLTTCSHAGLVEEGCRLLEIMRSLRGLDPSLEHYACMVDLFSRAGHLDKALLVIEKVPRADRIQLWLAFLGACQKWMNVELGTWAFRQALELDPDRASAYVCMGNIYAASGMHKEAARLIACWRLKHAADMEDDAV